MRIITPSYEIVRELQIPRKIERIARICYKSEDKIGDDTAEKMLRNLIQRKHFAMLEHASFCIQIRPDEAKKYFKFCKDLTYLQNKYGIKSYLRTTCIDSYLISGNIRAWIETIQALMTHLGAYHYYNSLGATLMSNICGIDPFVIPYRIDTEENSVAPEESDLTINDYIVIYEEDYKNYLSEKERMIHETMSIIFTVDRGVTHEIVRMREASFAQESTRYCNYSIGKFDNQLSIIKPIGFDEWSDEQKEIWTKAMTASEEAYMALMDTKMAAQMARGVLPQNIKADIAVTSTLAHWHHMFALRACDATGPAHPQMKEVMQPLLLDAQHMYQFAFGNLKMPK